MPEQKTKILFELADLLNRQIDNKVMLRLITEKTTQLLGVDAVVILMVNPSTQNTIKAVVHDEDLGSRGKMTVLQSNIVGWVIKNHEMFVSKNLATDDRFHKGLFSKCIYRSAICTQLFFHNNIIGYILAVDRKESCFDEKAEALVYTIASICAPYIASFKEYSHIFERDNSDQELLNRYRPFGLIGKSRVFIELLKTIQAAAQCNVRVLLQGRSGTGKELVARAIHQQSKRKDGPFIAIDCGAIPENLVESELFGHHRGAFTGAMADHKGLFELANNGTLFIDEIENLPLSIQSTMLRVLQENEIRPIGGSASKRVDVRIISASSSSLADLVKRGAFREDLYYRLYVFPIHVATLAERKEDIPLLALEFLQRFAQQQGKKVQDFEPEILHFLKNHDWPGNARELENFIERLVALADSEAVTISASMLPREIKELLSKIDTDEFNDLLTLRQQVEGFEKNMVVRALCKCGWNQSKTARLLGMSQQGLQYKIKKFSIQPPD